MLSLFMEDRLNKEEKTAVEKHLSECKKCSLEYDLTASIEGTLKNAKREKAPDYLKEMILSATFPDYYCKKEKLELGILTAAIGVISIVAAIIFVPFNKISSMLFRLLSDIQKFSTGNDTAFLLEAKDTAAFILSEFTFHDGLILSFIILFTLFFSFEFIFNRIEKVTKF